MDVCVCMCVENLKNDRVCGNGLEVRAIDQGRYHVYTMRAMLIGIIFRFYRIRFDRKIFSKHLSIHFYVYLNFHIGIIVLNNYLTMLE